MAEFAYRTLPETWRRYARTGVTELTKPGARDGSVSFGRQKARPQPPSHLLEVRQLVAARVAEARGLPPATLRRRVAQRYAAQVLPLPSAARPTEVRDLVRYLPTLSAPVLRAYLVAFELWQAAPRATFTTLFAAACDACGLSLDRKEPACLRA